MAVELNYTGEEKEFNSIKEAQKFAETLEVGFDIWVNDQLYQSTVKNFKTGEVETTFYK